MTLIDEWGPIMWIFFHTIIESLKDDCNNKIINELYNHLKSICSVLPCPICSKHANEYFNHIKYKKVNTKTELKHIFFDFHNNVNKKKNKVQFKIQEIENYKNKSLLEIYKKFIVLFSKKRGIHQLNQSFQNKIILLNFVKWIKINNSFLNFDK